MGESWNLNFGIISRSCTLHMIFLKKDFMTRFILVCVLKPSILNNWFSHSKLNIFSQLCPMINIAVIKNSAAHNIKSHIIINLSLDLMGKCHCYSRLNREVIIKAWLLFIIYSYCLIKATVKSQHALGWYGNGSIIQFVIRFC